MLGTDDRKIRDFLIALCQREGVINSTIAIAAAKVLIQSSSDPNLKRIKINTSWAQCLFEWDLLEGWQQPLKYQYLTKPAKTLNWFLCIR